MMLNKPLLPRSWRPGVLTLLTLSLLTAPLSATWSILIVDTATGEVAIGIATCLTGFDLRPNTVVVVPGYGVAAAQSFVGPQTLRQLIRAELLQGTPPSQILVLLAAADPGHQSRQYGIADVHGGTATFTGSGAGAWAGGLTGQVGTLVYAIQGNVLTGSPVITNAEQALINTPGTVAQKLMASMQAARLMGGDGRCSCSTNNPTACGSPPPNFAKSAHIGLMIVSRPGDPDSPCTPTLGCGAGTYFMDLNVANQPASAPDPVVQLQALFSTWQSQQVGRPDHFQSSVSLSQSQIPANGSTTTTATVTLRDALGALPTTSPTVSVSLASASTATDVIIGPVTALGGGVYTFDVTSGFIVGEAVLDVVANDGAGTPARISPPPVVMVGDPFGPCGTGTVNDGLGGFANVLQVDGSPGIDRIATVGFNQPFLLEMLQPPLQPPGTGPVGHFLLWARAGIPSSAHNFPAPPIGILCFAPPPFPVSAPTFLIADTVTGSGLLPATPTPWSTLVPGLPALAEITLQGAIVENLPAEIGLTNAILLRVILLPAPQINQVSPATPAPGTTVTIDGTNFQPGATVSLGAMLVTPTSVTPTQILFTMPAAIPCDTPVTVMNVDAQVSNASTINPTPVITSTFANSGAAAGGAPFFILGQHLDATTVTIGGTPATILSQNATFVQVLTPPGTPGSAIVIVTSPAGCPDTTTYLYL